MARKPAAAPPPDDQVGREVPHSLDAERSVLGAVLLSNTLYAKLGGALRPEHFFRRAHARVWAEMQRQLERPAGVADPVTLTEALKRAGELEDVGGAIYIANLLDGVPRAVNVRHYADIVIGHAQRRALIAAAQAMIAAAYDTDTAVEQLLADADNAVLKLRHDASSGSLRSLASIHHELVADLEWRFEHRGELYGAPTGFTSLDAITSGWQPKNLVIVAARPSIGKTTFVMQSTMHVAESMRRDGRTFRRAAVFSLEMDRLQLQYRLLSALSGIPLIRLQGGIVPDHASQEWQALSDAQERMMGMSIYIDDAPTQTVSSIRAKCRELQAEGGLDMVVIDYVQLMEGELSGRKHTTRNEEMTHMSRRLKVMAGDLHCPVLLLSQLNRGSTTRANPRPQMSDLRDSGALEQDADMIIFLHRKHHTDNGRTEVIVDKARNGPTGTAYLDIARETTRFADAPPPTPDEVAADKAIEQAATQQHFAKRSAIRKRTVRV